MFDKNAITWCQIEIELQVKWSGSNETKCSSKAIKNKHELGNIQKFINFCLVLVVIVYQ